jgi:hypothetical protein
MKQYLNFQSQSYSYETLETIQTNLKEMGIKAFSIDFESQMVCIDKAILLNQKDIECIFKNSGIACSCNSICKTIN